MEGGKSCQYDAEACAKPKEYCLVCILCIREDHMIGLWRPRCYFLLLWASYPSLRSGLSPCSYFHHNICLIIPLRLLAKNARIGRSAIHASGPSRTANRRLSGMMYTLTDTTPSSRYRNIRLCVMHVKFMFTMPKVCDFCARVARSRLAAQIHFSEPARIILSQVKVLVFNFGGHVQPGQYSFPFSFQVKETDMRKIYIFSFFLFISFSFFTSLLILPKDPYGVAGRVWGQQLWSGARIYLILYTRRMRSQFMESWLTIVQRCLFEKM